MSAPRSPTPALVVVPIGLVLAAYAWLAISAGNPIPWMQPVHEDGERTLRDTVLYWRHFLREIPVALLYATSLLIAAGDVVRRGSRRASAALGIGAAVGAGALCVLAILRVAGTDSPSLALWDLAQYYLRDDVGWPGAHWAAHYGAVIVFWCSCVLVFAPWRGRRRLGTTAVIFTVAVLLLGLPLLLEPRAALSGRILAHQAREIMTHLPITLPVSAYLLVGDREWPAEWRSSLCRGRVVATGIVGIAITALLTVGTLATDALNRSPAAWSSRVAGHLFEHSLDIALVLLLVIAAREALAVAGGSRG